MRSLTLMRNTDRSMMVTDIATMVSDVAMMVTNSYNGPDITVRTRMYT